jgi:hypothetical protein
VQVIVVVIVIGTVEGENNIFSYFLFPKFKDKATHNFRFEKRLTFQRASTIWKQVQVIAGKVIGTVEGENNLFPFSFFQSNWLG